MLFLNMRTEINRMEAVQLVDLNAWSTYCTKALEHRQWVVCLSDLFEEKKISATKLHRLVSIIIMLILIMFSRQKSKKVTVR